MPLPPRLIAARREACSWLADHPEIPSVSIDTHDGTMWVAIGTRTTHVVVAIAASDAVREKLGRAMGWLLTLVPDDPAP